MGQNRRYGSDNDTSSLNEVLIKPVPISLSDDERGMDVTRPEKGIPVHAWVRFPETPIRVSGEAIAWTGRAVLVEFKLRGGATRRAWVWANAVDRD
ncbi:hypothetical protein [Agromyces seonyuensis]|uniref:Uncharacterized protein n=1 Tax=Agromyces seonyuensis TaxID=2662446 RepID=A0A6I4P3K5_9MICO|nr:hypothetical protein [Agromyces seonyuensis]MWB99425.1 hypothetical protein [Agromyces seonyuensis]